MRQIATPIDSGERKRPASNDYRDALQRLSHLRCAAKQRT
jgi:hypothetical protein